MLQILPSQEDIYDMLSLLLGDRIVVEYNNIPMNLADKYVATYIDETGEIGALCCCDAQFAAFAGGSITLMPPDATKDAADFDDLSEMMVSNMYEVMNICTRLVINDETPHLKLDVVKKFEDLQDATAAILAQDNRGDYTVDIPRYGKGCITFFVR